MQNTCTKSCVADALLTILCFMFSFTCCVLEIVLLFSIMCRIKVLKHFNDISHLSTKNVKKKKHCCGRATNILKQQIINHIRTTPHLGYKRVLKLKQPSFSIPPALQSPVLSCVTVWFQVKLKAMRSLHM